jgi:hypothetical protein
VNEPSFVIGTAHTGFKYQTLNWYREFVRVCEVERGVSYRVLFGMTQLYVARLQLFFALLRLKSRVFPIWREGFPIEHFLA